MDTTKLKEALADLEQQREMIDEAITYTRKAISLRVSDKNGDSANRSLVDDAVDCLESYGTPLHIDKLTTAVGIFRGSPITRANLEASLSQHQKTANPRVVRVEPGIYNLSTSVQSSDDHGITDDDVPF